MPTYDYVYTDDAGGMFEATHGIKQDALSEHGGRPCKRLISRANVVFHGDGWVKKDDGLENFRKIYERNVEQAEPARKFARDRGIDTTSDDGAIEASSDNSTPDAYED
jgi:predicted nucleic acid-binding Zn ribbon protein